MVMIPTPILGLLGSGCYLAYVEVSIIRNYIRIMVPLYSKPSSSHAETPRYFEATDRLHLDQTTEKAGGFRCFFGA